jgi:hypothetical protein
VLERHISVFQILPPLPFLPLLRWLWQYLLAAIRASRADSRHSRNGLWLHRLHSDHFS